MKRALLRQKGRPPQGELFPPSRPAAPVAARPVRAPKPYNKTREMTRHLARLANGFYRP